MRGTWSPSGWGEGRARVAHFQGEETKAREMGRCQRQSGSLAFPVPRSIGHLSMHHPPIREKQQPAPRLTLRDLQNKSSCSSPISSATGLHTVSPEPPGPLQQPSQTELSLANITVPLESIKPSE